MNARPLRPVAVFLFVLLLAAPGCKKDPTGVHMPIEALLPPEAKLVMACDLAAARKSPLAEMVWSEVKKDQDMSAVATAFTGCYEKAGDLKLLIAADPDTEDFVLFLVGPGVGAESVLQCVEKAAAKERGEPANAVMILTRGPVRVAPQQDGGQAILLNKDTLAFVPKRWSEGLIKQIEAHKPPAEATKAAAGIPGLGGGVDLWLRVALTDQDRAEPDALPGTDSLLSAAIQIDLKAGIAMQAALTFKAKDSATQFAAALTAFLTEAQTDLAQVPQLAAVLKTFKYAPDPKDEKVLRLEGAITNEQVPVLIGQLMGGKE